MCVCTPRQRRAAVLVDGFVEENRPLCQLPPPKHRIPGVDSRLPQEMSSAASGRALLQEPMFCRGRGRPLCQLSSKRFEEKWYNWYSSFVEDERPLCQLSSKHLEEKGHNWYSTALYLCKTSAPVEALTRMLHSSPLAATGSRTWESLFCRW